MVQVFREVKRVLRDDGCCWVNIGDSYAGGGNKSVPFGLNPKDLCLVPQRLALALQAAGWYVRSEIIWAKKAPMPESVTDRPTKSHEQIWLLTKQERYWYDADAVRERLSTPLHSPGNKPGFGEVMRNDFGTERMQATWGNPAGRNQRDVWTLGPEPFAGAHFATFPTEIPRRCIKASTSERGVCPTCGAQWERVVENGEKESLDGSRRTPPTYDDTHLVKAEEKWKRKNPMETSMFYPKTTTGFRPTCACPPAEPIPATVLDPFNGAGTTGLVCQELNRRYIGLDLSGEYLRMSQDRLGHTALEAWQGNGNGSKPAADLSDLPMFAASEEE
jgi:DNA modification methylase